MTETPYVDPQTAVSPLVKDRWACPKCKGPSLREAPGAVLCGSCGASYAVHRGIPLFLGRTEEADPRFELDLTVLVLALNEKHNVVPLVDSLKESMARFGIAGEILVVDGGSTDGTPEAARSRGAEVLSQAERGYGRGLREGFRRARGRHVLTMDADLSHPAKFVEALWGARDRADLVIASRFVPGSGFEAPLLRKVLSRILNRVYRRVLSVPVRDVSSGFRLYRAAALRKLSIDGVNFEALEEILIKLYMDGWTVAEVPFRYVPRVEGHSKARLWAFGLCLLKTLAAMWRVRSSIAAADYDERAFDSPIPLQMYWQRKRHAVVLRWARRCTGVILDAGCGSSRILQDLPLVVGLDPGLYKLRYMRRKCDALVEGSVFDLPFRDASFEGAICSQVIEHVPGGDRPFQELARVIRPGGLLVIGTPDYGRPWWPFIERVYQKVHPQGYADEHITHYTLPSLREHLERAGFEVLDHHYILGAELNVLARRT